jgi:hypothetical protein
VTAEALILKRASASRPSGEWNDDDFDVLAEARAVPEAANRRAKVPVPTPEFSSAFGGTADIDRPPAPIASEAYDPKRRLVAKFCCDAQRTVAHE